MSTLLCPDCGQPLPARSPGGQCPACLLRLGLEPSMDSPDPEGDGAGEEGQIGRYRLLEVIGEGAFGTVWMAEQTEPVRRKVALKILKLGMDTKEVVARFEAERQALALMEHPNIARVFDGGATPRGRPYFVMELVQGVRITDYCDAHRLETRDRLQLFKPICQAVQHAHQKGVIHRDLKPSNILVAEQDGRPVPKVIDFGIAKATGQDFPDKTFFTRFNQLIGTPAYMSPEQASLRRMDVDTRSDIYSLGVLLYELLTGRAPFSDAEFRQAGLDGVLRIIREKEPPKPSAHLSTLAQADLQTVARLRGSDPVKLNRLLRGELDWVVMKCLEKDRARRYETANGLARDIERYLANEPVTAAAPRLGYRLAKLATRHRLVVTTCLAFLPVLIAALILSLWQGVRANRAATSERAARQELLHYIAAGYFGEMNLAAEAVRINSLGRARDLLKHHRGTSGQRDFRHWEWSYLLWETRDQATGSLGLPGAVFNRLGIAPDGRTLAVPCGRTRGVQLWDVASRTIRGELPVPCFQAFFSPDSHWIGAVVSQQGRLDIFNAQTGELAAGLPRDTQVNDVAFSPDGSLVAITADHQTAGSQMMLRLWRWRDKTMLAERGFPSFKESFHYKIVFLPDGQRLAIGENQGGVRLLRATDLADDKVLAVHDRGVTGVAVSPDGRWLAAGVDGRDNTISLWDLPAGSPPMILRGHSATLVTLAFSPDNQWLASGAGDQTIRLWGLPQGRLRATLRGHQNDLRSVAFLGDPHSLASGDSSSQIKFWDLSTKSSDADDLLLPPLSAPLLTEDFQQFAGLSTNRVVSFGSVRPSPAPREMPELGDSIRLLAMTPNGGCLATVDASNTVRVLRRSDGHLSIRTNPHPSSIARLGFVQRGQWLVSITDKGHVQRWTTELDEVRPAFTNASFDALMMPTNFILTLSMAIQDPDFVFCNTLGGRQVMSLRDGRLLGAPVTTGGELGGCGLSWDGRRFAAGNQNGQVEIYDTATWQRIGEPLNCHSDWLWRVAFSPDGRRLVTGGSGREPLRLWDVESRQQVCTLPIEPAMPTLLQFSADGRSLAFGTPSGQVRILTVELPR